MRMLKWMAPLACGLVAVMLGRAPAQDNFLAEAETINVSTAGVVRETVSTLEYMAAAHISAGDLRTGLNQLIAEYETWLGRLSR